MSRENIIQNLENFGLNDKQAKVYLACLELGQETVTNIAHQAEVERVHVYYLLGQLAEKGLISESQSGKKRVFLATDPRQLVTIAQERFRLLKEGLPEILALTNLWEKKPKIRIYEGKEGLAQILEDMIITMKRLPVHEREILEYVSADIALSALPGAQRSFINRRIKNKIRLRWIAPDTPTARKFESETKSPEYFREMRLVDPDKFTLLTEMNIYGDKINLLGEKGQEIGIIIEHPEMAQSQREIFELAWVGAQILG